MGRSPAPRSRCFPSRAENGPSFSCAPQVVVVGPGQYQYQAKFEIRNKGQVRHSTGDPDYSCRGPERSFDPEPVGAESTSLKVRVVDDPPPLS